MLKFQSAIKFLNFGRSPIYTITFYSLVTPLFIIKFGSDRMKTGGGVAFEIFAPKGSHVNENEKKKS